MHKTQEPLLGTSDVARIGRRCAEAVRLAEMQGRIKAAVRTTSGARFFTKAEALRWAATLRPRSTDDKAA